MLAGYSLAARASTRPMHKLIYVLALAATLYVIVDIEFPRTGFVQITELRETAFAALRMRMT